MTGKRIGINIRRTAAFLLLCLSFLALLSGCASQTGTEAIRLHRYKADGFDEAVELLFPGHEIIDDAHIIEPLKTGALIEAYDAQVQAVANENNGRYWLPLTLETVVIAVDRSRTDAEITSWNNLLNSGAVVSITTKNPYARLLTAALCYGLEGEDFTMNAALALLEKLYSDGRLEFNDADAPIRICFDADAVKMKKDNPAIGIIIPSEGTLSYTRGLFSVYPLALPGDADVILLGHGLRLPDGRCENSLYPDAAAYAPAKLLADYSHLNTVMQDWERVIRREVRHTRLYSSADGREHMTFALVYIIIAVFWMGAITRRTLRKDVRRNLFVSGIMLVAWMTLRIMKYTTFGESVITRYAWYMYYFFQLALPLVMLRITSLVGSAEEKPRAPLWYECACGINAALFLLVITNDLHKWIFRIDLSLPRWEDDYTYGLLFFAVIGAIFAELVAAVVMLFKKAKDSPRRMGFIFPLTIIAALLIYSGGYAAGIPFFAESDLTMMIGVFSLLFLELCIRTGQLPVNTEYRKLFHSAANRLQILDGNGSAVLSGDNARPVGAAEWESLKSGGVTNADENTLLYAKEIIGGYSVWQVDVTAVNAVKKQIWAANGQLAAANDLLEKEEQIKGQAAEIRARRELYDTLERNLSRHQKRLAGMLGDLSDDEAGRKERIASISLLMCYTKRKCQLLFIEMSGQENVSPGEFFSYLNTLAEVARLNGVDCLMMFDMRVDIPVRHAILYYDFFVLALECAAIKRIEKALVNMLAENGWIALKILMPPEALACEMDKDLGKLIEAEKGLLTVNDLEGMAGFTLSFPIGGEPDA